MKPNTLRLSLLALMALLVTLLFSCTDNNTGETIRLQQEWFPYSGFAGEVAAIGLAKSAGLNIRLEPGSESTDPIKAILSDSADVGVASVDALLGAVAKGADLLAIGVINHRTPTCFLVKRDSPIQGFRDFPGHRIGILPGTNTERVYALVMQKLGIDRSSLQEITIPFDLQTFALGEYDVRPAFVYDEPVSLHAKQVDYRLLNPFEAVPDLSFLGTVYFARRSFLESRRDDVVKLLRALRDGWREAASQPEQVIQKLVRRYPDLDATRELESLKRGLGFFGGEGGRLLWASSATWQGTISSLEQLQVIGPGSLKVEMVWDEQFLKSAEQLK